jgi:acetate kinase
VVGDAYESRKLESLAEARDVVAVGHRVVHGGEIREPRLVDDELVAHLESVVELAPVHNKAALEGIADARRLLPSIPHVAVFDTAFHATIPDVASTYALPERFRAMGIRRYGFHGLSVEWAAAQVQVARLVVCHLGGGASVTAVLDGRSVDTTMGFTPLEGVVMARRAGSVDPGALLYLLRHGVSVEELDEALEHESGLVALGGTWKERQLEEEGSPALDVYCYRIACAVAAMQVPLGGLDAIVFTGGVGEHSELVRSEVCRLARIEAPVHVVESREDVVVAGHVRELLG